MTYDVIVIGAGLSGMTCAIALAQAGKRVAVLAPGSGTLPMHSGSFDLLGYDSEGNVVERPFEAIGKLDPSHPYSKIVAAHGMERIEQLAGQACAMINDLVFEPQDYAGSIASSIQPRTITNQYRLTPMGALKPTWLRPIHLTAFKTPCLEGKQFVVAHYKPYIDFPVEFLAEGLRKAGAEVQVKELELNITSVGKAALKAPALARQKQGEALLKQLDGFEGQCPVLVPHIFGDIELTEMNERLDRRLSVVPTLPPTCAGHELSDHLRSLFTSLGGTLLEGDRAMSAIIENDRIVAVKSSKHVTHDLLQADHYVIASGSFGVKGLEARYDRVAEPIFDLDIDALDDPQQWTTSDVLSLQPYTNFGVRTDERFRTSKHGRTIENLYAVGSILSNTNSIKLACRQGVSMFTALQVANGILEQD
ncbi:MAG: anaerobic glycerol-3-phosphate dehydrogenase subunit B [Muribaculaceae bacterium]|nr:anaerobic glycerol-3-phosphate dehydrogenase subunit B [Muribaculaceae bacterium]